MDTAFMPVSMKSGLEDRNNKNSFVMLGNGKFVVSMKSGLEDRNNRAGRAGRHQPVQVSMKSGLEDRNNDCVAARASRYH